MGEEAIGRHRNHRDRPGLIPGVVFVSRGIVARIDEHLRVVEIGRSRRVARVVPYDQGGVFPVGTMLTGEEFIEHFSNPGLISRNT